MFCQAWRRLLQLASLLVRTSVSVAGGLADAQQLIRTLQRSRKKRLSSSSLPVTDPDSRLPSDQLIRSTYSSYGTLRKAVWESLISVASMPADSCALTWAYGIDRPFWSHHKSGRKTSVAASDKLCADSFTVCEKWMRRTSGSMSGWRGKKPKFLDVHWLKFTSGKIPRTRCPIGILRITPGYSVWLWCFRKEESQSKTKVTLFLQLYLRERLRISLGCRNLQTLQK